MAASVVGGSAAAVFTLGIITLRGRQGALLPETPPGGGIVLPPTSPWHRYNSDARGKWNIQARRPAFARYLDPSLMGRGQEAINPWYFQSLPGIRIPELLANNGTAFRLNISR